MVKRAGQLRIGLFEGCLQRLSRSLPLLCRRVTNGFELTCDRDRRTPCGCGQRGANFLGASLRPSKTVFDVGREAPECRLERFTAARDIADERLEAAAATFKGGVKRLLLLREIASHHCKSLRMLGELPGQRARVGLGRG